MAIAKVVYKENASATPEVWMDTTQKTVTAGTMLSGTTALKNDGTGITGNIASKSSSDLTASGATVTAPAGYYPNAASKAVASGTAGTPTATKGTVSNHSISVTPSVTNATGYITGSTISGTAVTVDVTELESGTKSITENGTGISVSGYSAVDVDVAGQVPTETLYIWTDRDGIGAWNVAAYAKCSVNGAPVKDGHSHVWVNVQSGETIYIKVSGLSISWGDGASTTWPGGTSYIDQSHTYSAGGYYHIELSKSTSSANGRFAATTFASNSNMSSIKSIEVNYSENNTNQTTNQTQCNGCTGIITGSAFVSSITNYTFGGCTSLKKFVVGDMVQTISDNAFNGCVTLENIYLLPQTPPTLSSVGAFTNVPSSCKFIVPEGCLSAYQGATNWSNFSSQMIEGEI